MTLSALVMGVLGLILLFLPQEAATYWGQQQAPNVLVQLLGALYISFALVNWTAKKNLIGGIYSRPLSVGNFTHFLIGSLVLVKSVIEGLASPVVIGSLLIYGLLSSLFGSVFFTHPTGRGK